MNRFTNRQKEIIQIIEQHKQQISGKIIATELGVSVRTLQNEVRSINRILPVIESTNKGYSVNKETYKQLKVGSFISEDAKGDILKELLFAKKTLQIDSFADQFYLSTQTLENYIRQFNEGIIQYNLHISREKNHIQIVGMESDKRVYIQWMIAKKLNFSLDHIDELHSYFKDIDVERVQSIILNVVDSFDFYIDQIYIENVMIGVITSLYRMREGFYITEDVENMECENIEYKISKEICTQYGMHRYIHPTHKDVCYIATLFVGQIKSLALSENVPEKRIKPEFIRSIDKILNDTFQKFLLDIDYSRQLYGFALHVDAMIKRAKVHRPAQNVSLNTLKNKSPFIHDIAVYLSEKIASQFQVTIAESEIGFISVHIGYLIEDVLQNNKKVNVLLYCDDYHNILEKIKKALISNLSDFIQLYSVPKLDEDIQLRQADLIITTKKIKIFGKRVIEISPFYQLNDQIAVLTAIQDCMKQKNRDRFEELFHSYFDESLFFTDKDLKSDEETIHFLGQKLIDKGVVKKGFIESVLQREKLSPTCYFDTFAIPHAMELNAKHTMCCVALSKKGIPWQDSRVHIVLMIAVRKEDRNEFMELYEAILQSLDSKEKAKEIMKSNSFEEFVKNMSGY